VRFLSNGPIRLTARLRRAPASFGQPGLQLVPARLELGRVGQRFTRLTSGAELDLSGLGIGVDAGERPCKGRKSRRNAVLVTLRFAKRRAPQFHGAPCLAHGVPALRSRSAPLLRAPP
jgi:hypothetical protein